MGVMWESNQAITSLVHLRTRGTSDNLSTKPLRPAYSNKHWVWSGSVSTFLVLWTEGHITLDTVSSLLVFRSKIIHVLKAETLSWQQHGFSSVRHKKS